MWWVVSGTAPGMGRCARYEVETYAEAVAKFRVDYPGYLVTRIEQAEEAGRKV